MEPDAWQQGVLNSDARRLLLLCSRQSGKSTTCASLAVHQALYDPGLVLLIAPAQRQSSELFRKVREVYTALDDVPRVTQESAMRLELANGSRIIALPAYLGGSTGMAGLKWIASFPGNVEHGLQRASALLLLNDERTGFPFAVLEAGQISAARTAASAALAARTLAPPPRSLGIVGGGLIARTIVDHLAAIEYLAADIRCHDLDAASAQALANHLGAPGRVSSLADCLAADLVVFATTAPAPYVDPEHRFGPGQLVLNISLRDLAPATLTAANNVLDDVEHCLKADTSPHLLEQALGHREFVTGTLSGVLRNEVTLDPRRPTIFSPFGLGVLDLAVGAMVYRATIEGRRGLRMESFYGAARRW